MPNNYANSVFDVFGVSHLTGEIFACKKSYPIEKEISDWNNYNTSHKRDTFSTGKLIKILCDFLKI